MPDFDQLLNDVAARLATLTPPPGTSNDVVVGALLLTVRDLAQAVRVLADHTSMPRRVDREG